MPTLCMLMLALYQYSREKAILAAYDSSQEDFKAEDASSCLRQLDASSVEG